MNGLIENNYVESRNINSNNTKITPGYKKFVVDETTADYDYVKGEIHINLEFNKNY